MSDDDDHDETRKTPKRPTRRKRPERPQLEPYRVGKGNPPREYRFKKGQPSPNPRGRPKGSKNKSDLEKLLDKRVVVGEDALGRKIRKQLRDVISYQLVKLAAAGDLRAIKIVMDSALRYEALKHNDVISPEEMRAKIIQEEDEKALRHKLSRELINQLEMFAQLKKMGVIENDGADVQIAAWVQVAAEAQNGGPID